MGEHTVELVIHEQKVPVTPTFFTYDASKVRVGELSQQGHVGIPIEFEGADAYVCLNCNSVKHRECPARTAISHTYVRTKERYIR